MKKILKSISLILLSILFMFNNIIYTNAATTAKITVTSSTSKIVVGNTFNVTITVSSSVALGSWGFTPSYDTKKFKLISGETPVADQFTNTNTKSKSYTYKFKAIATGSGKITVKAPGVCTLNDEKCYNSNTMSIGSKTITVITQAQLEASYSKNNNLKSLSVSGLTLTPTFSKDKLEYKAEADTNTEEITIKAAVEDSKSSLTGTGVQKVSEGENKFNITVTAQNGSTKTYTVIVNVKDPNPITIDINNEQYTVVKRESSLTPIDGYEKTQIEINEQKIPAFHNEINNFTLVGLKDKDGNLSYYIYDKTNNTYNKYVEANLSEIKLYPLKIDKNFDENYEKSKIEINGIEFETYRQKNSEYHIIHAKNLLTGKDGYYTYDSINNSIIRYTEESTIPLMKKIEEYKKLILILGIETIVIILILICMLISNISKKKKRKKQFEQERIKKELEEQRAQKRKMRKKEADE